MVALFQSALKKRMLTLIKILSECNDYHQVRLSYAPPIQHLAGIVLMVEVHLQIYKIYMIQLLLLINLELCKIYNYKFSEQPQKRHTVSNLHQIRHVLQRLLDSLNRYSNVESQKQIGKQSYQRAKGQHLKEVQKELYLQRLLWLVYF
ncbi:unnamed protein product [Paramecium octaurelia]|uniref:Uncharacterized protein n=1 Tax=Paramecium octaurelia TaxID=43137 RepID=A0A8S1WWI3_PAROT|nr:unnamed protein product [Paramecium octaurelia]